MTDEQFEREMRYRTVMAVVKSMLERGLISKREFDEFEMIVRAKHNPLISGFKGKD